MRIPLAHIMERAKERPEGYFEEVIAQGRVVGTDLIIDDAKFDGLWRKFRGLGDVVAAVAQPVAGAIDAVLGTNLKNCGGCAQRQDDLNRLVPLA